jgi:hypothetical protein
MKMYKRTRILSAVLFSVFLLLAASSFAIGTVYACPSPTITMLPPAGPVGIPATVKGTGFTPGASVNINWFGFIVDVPGISGHIGYYTIRTGVTVGSDGNFTTGFTTPYDFSDIAHFVNATQNGVGTGITNATFTIVPSLSLSPQAANYTDGQQAFINVHGAPLGTAAVAMGLKLVGQPGEVTVLKLTYDNTMWGFVTSHLATEGPIVTKGSTGDIGGNASIRFNAVGGVGTHIIRGYIGAKDTSVFLPCEIGGQAVFNIVGSSSDSKTTVTNTTNTGTVATNTGTVGASFGDVNGATNTGVNYVLYAMSISAITLSVLLVAFVRKKTYLRAKL